MRTLLVAGVLIVALLALVVRGGSRLPDDVQTIAWNREACGHCRMLIGDPAFAAQVIATDGTVLSFDDPGCAIRYLRANKGRIHRAWFHAGGEDRWIPAADVAFVRVATSPMGSNVIAVARATPGAITLEDMP